MEELLCCDCLGKGRVELHTWAGMNREYANCDTCQGTGKVSIDRIINIEDYKEYLKKELDL